MRLSAARCTGLLLIGALVTLPSCASTPAQPAQPALAPQMTIERFLRAANQNDLDTMAALFGTRDGPITRNWSRREADDRMFLLASLLRHSDYRIESEQLVPGRREEATQFTVRLVVSQGPVNVPFTLVQTTRNRTWLIEQIGIERITNPGRRP
jgi:hypothetical protein